MKTLIVANWKCNPITIKEAQNLASSIEQGIADINDVKVVICPPSIFLPALLKEGNMAFGAQNCFSEDKGAFTGEISVRMLESMGVEYVIIGHSERRTIFKETNGEINKKVIKALDSKVIPILCIGENKEERENKKTFEVLEEQLSKCLNNVSKDKVKNLILAYEPVWAIGTGNFAKAEDIKEVREFLKSLISKIYDEEISNSLVIIYGGSVDSKNASLYLKDSKMEGLLVGGASLNAEEFLKIIKSALLS